MNASWKCLNSLDYHISPTKDHLYWGEKVCLFGVSRQIVSLQCAAASSSIITLQKQRQVQEQWQHHSGYTRVIRPHGPMIRRDRILCKPFPY